MYREACACASVRAFAGRLHIRMELYAFVQYFWVKASLSLESIHDAVGH